MLGRIKTTEAKAKELRPYVEKLITRAKHHTQANDRLLRKPFSRAVVKKIMESGQSFSGRAGGYTRIIKFGIRKSDGAKMAIIELVK